MDTHLAIPSMEIQKYPGGSPPLPTPRATPAAVPPGVGYDGVWQGLTGYGGAWRGATQEAKQMRDCVPQSPNLKGTQ